MINNHTIILYGRGKCCIHDTVLWFFFSIEPISNLPCKFKKIKNLLRFSVATLFRFVARFARDRIEDPSFNRFALNGIQEIACFIVFLLNSKNKKILGNGAEMSGAETARHPNVQRRIGGAEMALPL